MARQKPKSLNEICEDFQSKLLQFFDNKNLNTKF